MTIIIGLGNPGLKFEKTRHNVGFVAIDKFAEKNNFSEFKLDKKSNALISKKDNVLLVKPQTFMNNSGTAVKQITKPYTPNPEPLLVVVHDDIDLEIGKRKIVKDRGSAGHKGVESIIKAIGNKNLVRLRIGIKPEYSRIREYGNAKAEKIVLKNFSKDEQKIIEQTLSQTAEALAFLLKNGLEKAMNEYNK